MDLTEREMDEETPPETSSGGRGFASMSEEKRRAIAAKGGRSQGKDNNPGNFANRDKEEVAKIGAKGGQHSRGGGRPSGEGANEE